MIFVFVWLNSLTMTISRSIQVAANGIISFFFMAVYMYHIFFIHSSVDGHLGCFHVLAIQQTNFSDQEAMQVPIRLIKCYRQKGHWRLLGTFSDHYDGRKGKFVCRSLGLQTQIPWCVCVCVCVCFPTSLLEYNCFTMVGYFLLYNKVNQLYVYIYPHISSLLRLPPTLPIPPL